MYSSGSPDEWDLLWEFSVKADLVPLPVAQKSVGGRQASFSSKPLVNVHGPTDGLGNGRYGRFTASASMALGLVDAYANPASGNAVCNLGCGSCADLAPAERGAPAPQLKADVDPVDHFCAFPTFPPASFPTSSVNSLPAFILPPISVESSPEHPALFARGDVAIAAATDTADIGGDIPAPSDALFFGTGPCPRDVRSRSASNSTGGAAAESSGPCASGCVPAAPAPDPEYGRGDVTSRRWFDPDQVAAAVDAADDVEAPIGATVGAEDGAVTKAGRYPYVGEQHAAVATGAPSGEGPCDMPAAAPTAAPPVPVAPGTVADAEPPWSLESLRRRCLSRDPRVRFLQERKRQQHPKQHQQQHPREEPHVDEAEADPDVCVDPQDIRGGTGGAATLRDPLGDHMPMSGGGGAAAAAAAAVAGSASPPLRPPMPSAPLPRRAKTTTARLLSRLRPTGVVAQAVAPTAGGARDVIRPFTVRQWDSSQLVDTVVVREADGNAEVGSGAGNAVLGVLKRRHSLDGALPRRGKSVRTATGRAVYGGEHGLGRRAVPSSSLIDEVQRALGSADLDDGGARAAAAAQGPKTSWRLPPPRRRFDFLQRVNKRRRVAGLGSTAAPPPPPPPSSSPRTARGAAAEGSWRPRRRTGLGFGAGDTRVVLEVDPLTGDPTVDWRGERDTALDSDEASGGDSSQQCSDGGHSYGVEMAAGSGGGSPALSLLQALDVWRTQRARSVRKTPDALIRLGLLADVAARCPTSVLDLEEMISLPRPFVRKYGQEVLEICRNHVHLQGSRARSAAGAAPTRGSSGGAGPRPPPPPPRRPEYAEGSREAAWEAAFAAAVGAPIFTSYGLEEQATRAVGDGRGPREDEVSGSDKAAAAAGGCGPEHQDGGSGSGSVGGCGKSNDCGGSEGTCEPGAPVQEGNGAFGAPNAPAFDATSPAEAPAAGSGSGSGSGSAGTGGSGAGLGTAPAAPRLGLTKARAARRHCASDPLAPPGTAATAAAVAAAAAAPPVGADAAAAAAGASRSPLGKRPSSSREEYGTGPTHRSRKRRHITSPPAAAKATEKPRKTRLRLDLAAAAAAVRDPGGWVPLPAGCKKRPDSKLAYAATPILRISRLSFLLGLLAEAGPAAATAAAAGGGDAAASSPPPAAPAAEAAAQPPCATAVAMLPAAAVTAAAAAKALGRPAGLEHSRRLRAMVEAAMPAWEVRRVLACRALGAAAQAAAVLRLEQGASRDAVRVAFRRLSLLVHPDKNRSPGAAEAFALVSASANSMLGSSAA